MNEEVVIGVVDCFQQSLDLSLGSPVYGHQEHDSRVGTLSLVIRNLLKASAGVATYRTSVHDVQVVELSALL